MNRRIALKNVALTFGTMLSAPAWANAWTVASLPKTKSIPYAETLNQLVEALIPQTDTPGAAELGVDKFVMVMVSDCTPDEQRKVFTQQLGKIDAFSTSTFNNPFAGLNGLQKTELLNAMSVNESPEWKTFFGILKRYTVQGYQTSEYVMTKNGYEFVPGYFNGCVDLV